MFCVLTPATNLKMEILEFNKFSPTPVESYNGSSLRLPRLERRQMGAYLCIASNDVPPAVSKRVSLNVHCEYAFNSKGN